MFEYMGRCSSSIGLNSENPLFWAPGLLMFPEVLLLMELLVSSSVGW